MSEAAAPFPTGPDGLIALNPPVKVPDIIDALIVGGGPFGTAAAFRLTELKRSVLVIDYDDLMKRIRDYAKDKLILPDFGGGDRMQFPVGGSLIERLQFKPIDKDAMCTDWKSLYREFRVPAQVGVELTGLTREGTVWHVQTWNHRLKSEQSFHARHVVLAFGRGVPRRLDIPGDTEGLAFGLTEASQYVGEPALVIGGGTSAAEAVIAISDAKSSADDVSGVFWCYRAEKMPKVSRALAAPFFNAFVVNGNVRYLPNSEPVAVVTVGEDAFLSIRTSRKTTQGFPAETSQFEFKKNFCIACIGEDIPKSLLAKVGAPLVTGGPSNKERIAVTPLLETQQPNLYLAGDVLTPVYFETSDFGDPSSFKEIQRRGNIKAAMRDGVLVAEVINQKLAGRTLIDVQLQFAPLAADGAAAPVSGERAAVAVAGVPHPGADVTIARPRSGTAAPLGRLVSILPTGVRANEYRLKSLAETTIGKQDCDIPFPDDGAVSQVQARIMGDARGFRVRDEGSAQGIFLQPASGRLVPIAAKSVIRSGRQWLVVAEETGRFVVTHHDAGGRRLGRHELTQPTVVFGRQSPDVTIAPDDGSLSRRHLAFVGQDGALAVKDLGSQNGTFVRVAGEMRLTNGDRLHIGGQIFEFVDERVTEEPKDKVTFDTTYGGRRPQLPRVTLPDPPAPHGEQATAPAAAAPPVVPADQTAPSITFAGLGRTIPCKKTQTILEAAEHAGIKIDWVCREGICGADPIKVLSGGECLNPVGSTEQENLEGFGYQPGTHRFACVTRARGPVVVEIVKTH